MKTTDGLVEFQVLCDGVPVPEQVEPHTGDLFADIPEGKLEARLINDSPHTLVVVVTPIPHMNTALQALIFTVKAGESQTLPMPLTMADPGDIRVGLIGGGRNGRVIGDGKLFQLYAYPVAPGGTSVLSRGQFGAEGDPQDRR